MASTINQQTAPTDVLLNMAQKIGLDPTQYERADLRGAIDDKTADIRTVLNYKKTRQQNRDFNQERKQQQVTTELQGVAKQNREIFRKAFGGNP